MKRFAAIAAAATAMIVGSIGVELSQHPVSGYNIECGGPCPTEPPTTPATTEPPTTPPTTAADEPPTTPATTLCPDCTPGEQTAPTTQSTVADEPPTTLCPDCVPTQQSVPPAPPTGTVFTPQPDTGTISEPVDAVTPVVAFAATPVAAVGVALQRVPRGVLPATS